MAWDKRYGMTKDPEKIAEARLALGLYPEELTVLADFAAARAEHWTRRAMEDIDCAPFAEMWRSRAQRWNTLAASHEQGQTRFEETGVLNRD